MSKLFRFFLNLKAVFWRKLAGVVLFFLLLAFQHAAFTLDSTQLLEQQNITNVPYVSDVVPITFYATSGSLSQLSCPTSATSTTPTDSTSSTGVVYDQNLNAHTQLSGYTCNMVVSHYSTMTAASYLASIGVPTTPSGGACPAALYGAPTTLSCYQGSLSVVNNYIANTSVCYNPITPFSGCAGISSSGAVAPNNWVGVYYAFNNAVSSMITISLNSNSARVPSCSAGAPLLLNLSSNQSYSFTYTENMTFEQSYDGYKSNASACTCNVHHSIVGNSPANSSCSASITLTSGVKNQVSVNPNAVTSFIGQANYNPFTWLSGPACVIGNVTTSQPIQP